MVIVKSQHLPSIVRQYHPCSIPLIGGEGGGMLYIVTKKQTTNSYFSVRVISMQTLAPSLKSYSQNYNVLFQIFISSLHYSYTLKPNHAYH